MKNKLCFIFSFDIPYILRSYTFEDIETDHYYIDDMRTADNVERLVRDSYSPLLSALERMASKGFHCGLAINGITIDILERYQPDFIEQLQSLLSSYGVKNIGKGYVEVMANTYGSAMSGVYNENMFLYSLRRYRERVEQLFGRGITLSSHFNPQMLYSDEMAFALQKAGYNTCTAEYVKSVMSDNSPCLLHKSVMGGKLLVRSQELSDLFTYRFSDPAYNAGYVIERCLAGDTAFAVDALAKYSMQDKTDHIYNIFLGADTFGITQPLNTGILSFLESLADRAETCAPSEATAGKGKTVSISDPSVWTGSNKSFTQLCGNLLQHECLDKIYSACGALFSDDGNTISDEALLYDWLMLDHAAYLAALTPNGDTHYIGDGGSMYDAFICYSNIIADLLARVDAVK